MTPRAVPPPSAARRPFARLPPALLAEAPRRAYPDQQIVIQAVGHTRASATMGSWLAAFLPSFYAAVHTRRRPGDSAVMIVPFRPNEGGGS